MFDSRWATGDVWAGEEAEHALEGAGLAAEMHSTPAHLEELDRNPLCNLSKEEKVLTKISDKDLSCTILATTPLRSLLHRAHAHSSSPSSAPSSIFLTLFQKCPWTPVG